MNTAAVGIDVGSLGIRAAWARPDGPPAVVAAGASDEPWILAERGVRGVRFHTVREQRTAAAGTRLVAELAAVRDRVRADAGGDIARAVLTVPARMESAERVALRDAARAVGFTDVHLVNDSIAAVLADGEAGASRTVLVYSLGYSGFEVGLLRTARQTVRVLGHAGSGAPSGRGLDQAVMEAWLAGLTEPQLAEVREWSPASWVRLHFAAEEVKRALLVRDRVDCPWPPWSTVEPVVPALGTPGSAAFRRFAAEQVAPTVEQVRDVLGEAGLTVRDVDAVLLVGGSTALPAVRELLGAEFGGVDLPARPSDLAGGAAVYGTSLWPAAPITDLEFVEAQESPTTAFLAMPVAARSETVEDGVSPGPIAEARRLWSAGRPAEARGLLADLVDQATRLIAEIDRADVPKPSDGLSGSTAEDRERARRAIDRAVRWLREGRLKEAVQESHVAWKEAEDDTVIFRQMIDVHLRAARAASGAAGYPAARNWLHCAWTHHRFNEDVVSYLLERTLEQARHHHDRGQHDQARRLLGECMDINPDFPGVQELLAKVTAT